MIDDLMLVKFHFFKDIASVLSFYLTKFQTDAPTMPFLPSLLDRNLRQVMKMFLRAAVVDETTHHANRSRSILKRNKISCPLTLSSSLLLLNHFWLQVKLAQHKN